MDISGLTVEQLKAMAYDVKVQIELQQQNLQMLEQRITMKLQAEQEKAREELEAAEAAKTEQINKAREAQKAREDATGSTEPGAAPAAVPATPPALGPNGPAYDKVDENAKPAEGDAPKPPKKAK